MNPKVNPKDFDAKKRCEIKLADLKKGADYILKLDIPDTVRNILIAQITIHEQYGIELAAKENG